MEDMQEQKRKPTLREMHMAAFETKRRWDIEAEEDDEWDDDPDDCKFD